MILNVSSNIQKYKHLPLSFVIKLLVSGRMAKLLGLSI
jgi:hypothetical protein